jgi:hypothetical protein
MGIAGYVSVCVQLYCMLVSTVFHCMFRPTWPKMVFCFVKKRAANQKSSEAESLNILRILHTCRWPYRPKHVVKDSGNQHTTKLLADGNITCSTHWTIQCSRMLKYSIPFIIWKNISESEFRLRSQVKSYSAGTKSIELVHINRRKELALSIWSNCLRFYLGTGTASDLRNVVLNKEYGVGWVKNRTIILIIVTNF